MITVKCENNIHSIGLHQKSTLCVNPVEPKMTKARAKALAVKSTQHGYFNQQGNLWTRCPRCSAKVSVTYSMWAAVGRNEIAQIRNEVMEHLLHGECVDLPV